MPQPYTLPLEIEQRLVLSLSDPRDIIMYCNANPRNILCRNKNGYLWKRVSERMNLPHHDNNTYRDEIQKWLQDMIELRAGYILKFSRKNDMSAEQIRDINHQLAILSAKFPDDAILCSTDELLQRKREYLRQVPWDYNATQHIFEVWIVHPRGPLIPDSQDLIQFHKENPDGGQFSNPESPFWITLYWYIFDWPLPPNMSYKQVLTILSGKWYQLSKASSNFTTRTLISEILIASIDETDWMRYNELLDMMLQLWPNRSELHIAKSVLLRRTPGTRALTTLRQYNLWGKRRNANAQS